MRDTPPTVGVGGGDIIGDLRFEEFKRSDRPEGPVASIESGTGFGLSQKVINKLVEGYYRNSTSAFFFFEDNIGLFSKSFSYRRIKTQNLCFSSTSRCSGNFDKILFITSDCSDCCIKEIEKR